MTRYILAISAFAIALGLVLWAAAGAFSAASERSVRYRYLAEAMTTAARPADRVDWTAADVALDRAVTAADMSLIGRALTDAWQLLSVAQSSGRGDILSDGFTGPAMARARQSVEDARTGGGRMAVLAVEATPLFYHRDGSVFQAEVELLAARFLADEARPERRVLTRDRGVVTLMNEASGWRVFSWELRSMEPVETRDAIGDVPRLYGVNYYPAASPWRDFWPSYDSAIIERDLASVAGLRANAIRVFLPRADFLDEATQPQRLADLSDLLARAAAAGLFVVPTLFDLKGDYGPGTWSGDAAFLTAVIPVLRAAPNVALVDVKNEPDLDFERHGTGTVTAWLQAMTTILRHELPDTPVTIGWSSADAAPRLADHLDAISYHEYADPGGTSQRLAQVRRQAGGRPVFVTEIGASSFGVLGVPGSAAAQSARLGRRLADLRAADGVFVWTLHDFAHVDPTAVGRSPWVRRLQGRFGLIDAEGVEKPGATAVRDAFTAQTSPSPKG